METKTLTSEPGTLLVGFKSNTLTALQYGQINLEVPLAIFYKNVTAEKAVAMFARVSPSDALLYDHFEIRNIPVLTEYDSSVYNILF